MFNHQLYKWHTAEVHHPINSDFHSNVLLMTAMAPIVSHISTSFANSDSKHLIVIIMTGKFLYSIVTVFLQNDVSPMYSSLVNTKWQYSIAVERC